MKKLVVTILVSLVLSGCAKNKSQNDFIINSTEEEKETEVTLDCLLYTSPSPRDS